MIDQDALFFRIRTVAGDRAARPRVDGGRVSLLLDASGLDAESRDRLEADVAAAVRDLPGVTDVRIALSADRAPEAAAGPKLVAVASGKGGVGKSTLAANLAVALARAGVRVGLIDADIYGPSQPRLMGAERVRPVAHDKRLVPVATAYGVPMLSMGQLVEPDRAIAWRGPMTAGALGQLVEAHWAGARVLIVDLPPGTGDVQLTMIQKYRPAAALIVSTPQDLALIDARRAIDLFEKAGVPIAGLIENMAGYACPSCGVVSDPFGRGGVEAAAAAIGLPFLGRIPLDRRVLDASEAGVPPAAGDGPEAAPFHDLARVLIERLDLGPRSSV